jgi:hypothetical protein
MNTKLRAAVWLSFDLGIRGNYEGLYAWLDERGAKECGDGVAYFAFDWSPDVRKSLTEELKAIVDSERARVYAIITDPNTGKSRGRFLLGRRKSPPWTGFGPLKTGESDDVDI